MDFVMSADLLPILIAGLVGAAYLGAIVFAIVQAVRSPELADNEKLVWVIAIVCAPLIAAIVWFAAGPHPFGLRLPRA